MGHLIQPSCRSRVTYSRLQRTLSRRVLNISREGNSKGDPFLLLLSVARAMVGSRPCYVYRNFHCTAARAAGVSSETADPSLLLRETDAYALPSRSSQMARPLQGAGLCWEFTLASPHPCFLDGATGLAHRGTADKDTGFAGKNIQADMSLRELLQPLCPQVPPSPYAMGSAVLPCLALAPLPA